MQFSILVVVAAAVAAVYGSNRHGCKVPSNEKELKSKISKQIFRDYLLGRPTFNAIPEYRQNVMDELEISKKKTNYRDDGINFITKLVGESKCQKAARSMKRACPHYFVLDYDENREPAYIAKASCSCTRCRSYPLFEGIKASRCEPVINYIPVIRRVCHTKVSEYYRYIRDLEPVPVGCTCSMPS
ncbi:uncharacterized protein LOC128232710 [Mya arenaria]|uniref:uncharacterized protein LOC128232710 n=1 Tax=Mya arenaria TaxID=6604 RepID=UPI0022E3A7A1|nr:uncharacterized protein LOC128232710 [Mya arenaria]